MSNIPTNLDQVNFSQGGKETSVNAFFDAASPAIIFGRRASTCVGLTWGYYGGMLNAAGVLTLIPNGTVTLTASATNYIYATAAGVVTVTTTTPSGWPNSLAAGAFALYQLTVGASGPTAGTDYRTAPSGTSGANWSVSVNAQTGTTYTVQASDNGKVITLSNASPITMTVPSGLGANFAFEAIQIGAGQVTVAAGSGATVNSYGGLLKFAGQHAAATFVAYVADIFNLSGNLTA